MLTCINTHACVHASIHTSYALFVCIVQGHAYVCWFGHRLLYNHNIFEDTTSSTIIESCRNMRACLNVWPLRYCCMKILWKRRGPCSAGDCLHRWDPEGGTGQDTLYMSMFTFRDQMLILSALSPAVSVKLWHCIQASLHVVIFSRGVLGRLLVILYMKKEVSSSVLLLLVEALSDVTCRLRHFCGLMRFFLSHATLPYWKSCQTPVQRIN